MHDAGRAIAHLQQQQAVVVVVVFSHIQRIGCQPEKTTLHSGQSRSWSAEQGKKEQKKKSGSGSTRTTEGCSEGLSAFCIFFKPRIRSSLEPNGPTTDMKLLKATIYSTTESATASKYFTLCVAVVVHLALRANTES